MCVKNQFFKHNIPMTNSIRMRCISGVSNMPACVARGLSHLYLFNKTVVCNDKADALNRFACVFLDSPD